MTLEEAVRTIGLRAMIAAFAEELRLAHPDHGGDAATAEARIVELKQARDTIKTLLTIPPPKSKIDCKQCGGRGSIIGTFGATPCRSCGGTGEAL